MAGVAELEGSVGNRGVGVGHRVPGASRHAGVVARQVVVAGIIASSESKEKHVDDNLVHLVVVKIKRTDQTDVGSLNIEVAGIRHAQVETTESEKHAIGAVKALGIGNIIQSTHTVGERHRLELYDAHLIVKVHSRLVDDRGDANKL